MQFGQMPSPPPAYYQQTVYDNNGYPIQAQAYPPQYQYYQQPQKPISVAPIGEGGLGLNFSGLIGTNVSVPIDPAPMVPATSKPTTRRKKKSDKSDDDKSDTSSATQYVAVGTGGNPNEDNIALVEETRYADTYQDTTYMLRGAIAQIDQLSSDLKTEIDKIRMSNNMKGKYTYLSNLSSSMAGLISTKVNAIREINSSIKNINDSEYRRYKDIRTHDAEDDSKMIMDMYNAYIKTPIGTMPGVQYNQPNTLDITSGLNGIVRVDNPGINSVENQRFGNFMNNLSPEQNYMINEGNPDIEEVMIYDQATGKKYFQWMNMRTGQEIPNMPTTPLSVIEDFTIDPNNRIAKNVNLHTSMKVVYKNEGGFDTL